MKASAGSATLSSSNSEGAQAPRGPVPALAGDATSPEHSGLDSRPPHLGLGKGQAGVGTEPALTMNKTTVPCTKRCRCFLAWRGGCGVGQGGGGWLWRGCSLLWPFGAGSLWVKAGGFARQVPLSP